MRKTAFIWRESVYKNDFKCNECGTVLATTSGEPLGTTLYDNRNGNLICPDCGNCVAMTKEIDAPEVVSGKQGYWRDFEKGNRS